MRRLIGVRVLTCGGSPPGAEARTVAEYRLDPVTGEAVPVVGRDTMINFMAERAGVPIHGGMATDRRVADMIEREFAGWTGRLYFTPRDGPRFLLAVALEYGNGERSAVELIFEDDGGAATEGT